MNCPLEEALIFPCQGEHLLGVLSRPRDATHSPVSGVVIVVGGPQYRAGSHRQFVQWARALATAGTPTLRFDARGMGDSTGELRRFTALSDDVGAAITAMQASCPGIENVVLCGLCDGASAALIYLHERNDPRVSGVIALNPWVRSEQSLARTFVKHYYLQRMLDRGFWAKLLRGQVAARALKELASQVLKMLHPQAPTAATTALSYQAQMASAMRAMQGPVLLALSANDYTAKEFLEHCAADATWAGILRQPNVQRLDLPEADHTVSATSHRLQLEAATVSWLAQFKKPGTELPPLRVG